MTEASAPPELLPSVALSADRLTWGFVLLGAIACAVRYGVCFPLGADESFLVLNVARRDAFELLQPLDYHQVAPPLFLLVEELLTRLGGFNEWTVRAAPFTLAVVALGLFRAVARRVLAGWGYVLAVGIFCVSYWIVRYSSEAKPYSFDLCISAALLLAALRWADARTLPRLVALAALALVAFGFSFPSVFIGGGVVASMVIVGLRPGQRHLLGHAAAVGAALVAGFGIVYFRHTVHQESTELTWMRGYWERAFPPLPSIGASLYWLLRRASGELMPYPIGGKNFGSTLTLLACAVGAAAIVRERRPGVLWLLGVPIGLTLLAACVGRYPFGAPTRCQLHLAPVFCLCAGAGLAAVLRMGAVRSGTGHRAAVACGVLVCIATATMVRDLVQPAKTSTDEAHRDLARVVWRGGRRAEMPVLCLREDLGVTFTADLDTYQSPLVTYLANYHVYARPDGDEGGRASWPEGVRVVNHRVGGRTDEERRRRWIGAFEREHALHLAGSVLLPVPEVDNGERVVRVDVVEVMRFDPGPPAPDLTEARR